MTTGYDEASGNELRPGRVGAVLRLLFISLMLLSIGVVIGVIARLLIPTKANPILTFLGALAIAMILNIVLSQLAAQVLLKARLDGNSFSFITLVGERKLDPIMVKTIYIARNSRYTNVIINTGPGPRLLSDAIWSHRDFEAIEATLRHWASINTLEVAEIGTVSTKTDEDRLGRKLLLLCFRQFYWPCLATVLGISIITFLITLRQ